MPRIFSIKPSLKIRGRTFKGIRGWSGKPFHPPLTDLPVAAYILVGAADLVSYIAWQKGRPDIADDFFVTGTHVIIAGAAVSVLTIGTGFWDWLRSAPSRTQAWRTANWHMAVMLVMSLVVAVDIVARLGLWGTDVRFADEVVLGLSLAAAALVSLGSLYGGAMVYEFAFNVEQDIDYAYEKTDQDRLPGEEEPVQEVRSDPRPAP